MESRSKSLLLPALFLGSGFLTAAMYRWTEGHFHVHTLASNTFYELWIGLPFGIVAAALWARSIARISMVILAVCVAWATAHWTALYLYSTHNGYLALCPAGMVGGLGVTLAAAIGNARFRSAAGVAGGAVLGAIAAIPFARRAFPAWQTGFVDGITDPASLAIAFVLWQVATGVWLQIYADSTARQPAERATLPGPGIG